MKTIFKKMHHPSLNGSQGTRIHDSSFPAIRIDRKGRILYANKAAFPLLKEWNCLANDYIPDQLILQHPALLEPDADFDIRISTPAATYHLDIVGFSECGYIGMYGYYTGALPAEAAKQIHLMEL